MRDRSGKRKIWFGLEDGGGQIGNSGSSLGLWATRSMVRSRGSSDDGGGWWVIDRWVVVRSRGGSDLAARSGRRELDGTSGLGAMVWVRWRELNLTLSSLDWSSVCDGGSELGLWFVHRFSLSLSLSHTHMRLGLEMIWSENRNVKSFPSQSHLFTVKGNSFSKKAIFHAQPNTQFYEKWFPEMVWSQNKRTLRSIHSHTKPIYSLIFHCCFKYLFVVVFLEKTHLNKARDYTKISVTSRSIAVGLHCWAPCLTVWHHHQTAPPPRNRNYQSLLLGIYFYYFLPRKSWVRDFFFILPNTWAYSLRRFLFIFYLGHADMAVW